MTRLGGVIHHPLSTVSRAPRYPKDPPQNFNIAENGLRITNLETSLAGVTLLLLAAIDSDLASRRLSTRRFSFSSSHCWNLAIKVLGRKVYVEGKIGDVGGRT